jgi:hypothetical protein
VIPAGSWAFTDKTAGVEILVADVDAVIHGVPATAVEKVSGAPVLVTVSARPGGGASPG